MRATLRTASSQPREPRLRQRNAWASQLMAGGAGGSQASNCINTRSARSMSVVKSYAVTTVSNYLFTAAGRPPARRAARPAKKTHYRQFLPQARRDGLPQTDSTASRVRPVTYNYELA